MTKTLKGQLDLLKRLFPFHFVLDKHHRFIQTGKSFVKIFQQDPIEASFHDWFKILIPRDAKLIDTRHFDNCVFILESLLNKANLRGQMVFDAENEITYFIGSPLVKDNSDIKNFNLTINDFALYDTLPDHLLTLQVQKNSIDETALIAKKLNQKKIELQRSNEELKKFAYVASHDLKTPLRHVITAAQILSEKKDQIMDEEILENLSIIEASGRRIHLLINDLLIYYNIQQDITTWQKLNVNDILKTVETSLNGIIKEQRAVIKYPKLPQLQGNKSQIHHLFYNLVENGLKFHNSTRPKIKIDFKEKSTEWLFSVADNGIGIGESYHDKIFQVFGQLHSKDTYPGTGIGLAICKKIVEKHNGQIWLESKQGDGTTFFFTLAKSQ